MPDRSDNSNSTYLYYRLPIRSEQEKMIVDSQYILRVGHPKIRSLHSLLWTLLSFGKYRIYELVVDGEIVSTAQVMPYIPIFRFMKHDGMHIGPCVTKMQYRGHGYYPLLISKIAEIYAERQCYIFCHIANHASIRGIEKAGGQLYARGYKSQLGFYKISEEINQ